MNEIDNVLKTPYEYSVDTNVRVLDLHVLEEKWYFEHKVSKEEFLTWLTDKSVKPKSMPRKTPQYLEYRMYGLVPYNISSIQAGIQFGHAVVEYQQCTRGIGSIENLYNKWATQDKTFIILNGGTTNENKDTKWYGSLQQHRDILVENGVLLAEFKEPDLNNALTAIVFLVDERVFDRETYPDYVDMPFPWVHRRGFTPSDSQIESWRTENDKNRAAWVEKIGGAKNDFLRTHLRPLRLATN
jgi:hypothetical protein